jgi:FKBP-type peptidyl-prolyl cis-trans isomerase
MTLRKIVVWMAVLCLWLPAEVVTAQQPLVLKTQKERESYAVGVDLARKLQRQGIDADADALLRGMRDVLTRSNLLMNEADLQAAMNEFQTEMKQTRARSVGLVSLDNKMKGDAFLDANKAKDGVVSLPSGLQYRILKAGDGRRPAEADTVEVNYRGTRIDGTEFENSHQKGPQPATFKIAGVIPGWKEALLLMPVGSIWELFIPPQLAYGTKGLEYGKRGAGRVIGPNETLIYEMELVRIK